MDDLEVFKPMFYAQLAYGLLALAAILFASIMWRETDALVAALASCLSVIMCQHFAMARRLGIAIAVWWLSIAIGCVSLLLLLN